ncbi:unnamed protein product, partial [Laminaria digitata]
RPAGDAHHDARSVGNPRLRTLRRPPLGAPRGSSRQGVRKLSVAGKPHPALRVSGTHPLAQRCPARRSSADGDTACPSRRHIR